MSTSFKEIDKLQKQGNLMDEINTLKSQLATLVEEAKKEIKVNLVKQLGMSVYHNGEHVFELSDTQAVVHSGDAWIIYSSEDPEFFFVGKTLEEAFAKMMEYIIDTKIEYIKNHVLDYKYPLTTPETQEYYRDVLKENLKELEHALNLLRWARNRELTFWLE
ncbi:MAG: hypothetical protein QXJ23_09945 [Thermofilum sp.]|uniref:hypothetical protein n=1 Tax=Thermofilum sp. TaxID=1961369 RepID=UPI00316CBF33